MDPCSYTPPCPSRARAHLSAREDRRTMKRLILGVVVIGLGLGAALRAQNTKAAAAAAKTAAPVPPAAALSNPRDWPTVGNDPGGMKFSQLTQITPANVAQLAKTWTYDTGAPAAGYTVTPIVVNNVMYLPVQGSIIVALQADTGKELWKYDIKNVPGIAPNPSAGGRGISYWAGSGRV